MKLAQYIRAENMDNRMKIRQREQILYGTENLPPVWNKNEPLRPERYELQEGGGTEERKRHVKSNGFSGGRPEGPPEQDGRGWT